uniref:Uncharacterized protein n=1 Tax=Oryza brachyantha TaxID=4533 RepID=J3L0N3_ORYBR
MISHPPKGIFKSQPSFLPTPLHPNPPFISISYPTLHNPLSKHALEDIVTQNLKKSITCLSKTSIGDWREISNVK